MARHFLTPCKVEIGDIGRYHLVHLLLDHLHCHIITTSRQRVTYAKLAASAKVELHNHRAVIKLHRCEVKILGIKALRMCVQYEAIAIGAGIKKFYRIGYRIIFVEILVVAVIFQCHARYLTAV